MTQAPTPFALINLYASIAERLAKYSYKLGMFAVFFMMWPIVIDVIARLAFSESIYGAIELVEMSMLLMVVFCASSPQLNNAHMCVELIFEHFKPGVQRVLLCFHSLIGSVYIVIAACYLFEMILDKMRHQEYTTDLQIPLWIFMALAFIGIGLLFLALLRSALLALCDLLANKQVFGVLCVIAAAVLFCSLPWLLKGTPIAGSMALAGGLVMASMLTLLLLRMPIGYAMGIMGILGMMLIYPNTMGGMNMVGINTFHVASSYTYSVIPMFILMGEIALYSGISSDIFGAARTCLGRVPGGLAVASVAGCAGFAAICGDSLACAMTMGSVAMPEMKKYNYDMGLSTAAIAAGGTLGILIPPSIGFIFYSIVTEESLGRLFMAGVFPGVMLAIIFCVAIIIITSRDPSKAPLAEKTTGMEKFRSLKGVIPMFGLIVLVLGSILAGVCSPTEGGAVGAMGTLVYALATRRLTWKGFADSLTSTCYTTTRLMFILMGVGLLNYFFAATRLPLMLADWLTSMDVNRYVILLLVFIIYVILGCIMNVVPMILLTLPAIFPTIVAIGFDPIWFGVITVILMEMGQITPPVGIVVFALAGMPYAPPMLDIFKNVLPFVICMIVASLILVVFPGIATWLPSVLI